MTIYILSENPQETAQFLDDKSLDKMIHDITLVLKGCHNNKFVISSGLNQWTEWGRECRANYLYLVELAELCSRELNYRFLGLTQTRIKQEKILILARDNVPSLKSCTNKEKLCTPECRRSSCLWDREHTSIPLILPKKYYAKWLVDNCYNTEQYDNGMIQSYRNYYQAKIEQRYNKRPCLGTPHIFATVCIHCIWDSWWTNRQKPEFIKI